MASVEPWTMSSLVKLGLTHAVGLKAMYGLVFANGYIDSLKRLYLEGPFVSPLSHKPLLTFFTGILPLDKVLTLAGIMFFNILDGSTPQSSLYSFQFAGQLVPIWTVLTIEGFRNGSKQTFLTWSTLIGCLMQGTGYGFTFPLYCCIHLLVSPIAGSSREDLGRMVEITQMVPETESIPLATILGYVVPSILMSIPLGKLPGPVDWNLVHQWLAGLWQGFPVWILIGRTLLSSSKSSYERVRSRDCPGVTSREHQLEALHRAYDFSFTCAVFTQLSTYAIIAFRSTLPFSVKTRQLLTFAEVFLPPRFWNVEPMPNMGVGIMNFFQYDQIIGSLAAIVWASSLYRQAENTVMTWQENLRFFLWAFATALVGGPATVVAEMMRARDEMVLGKAQQRQEEETRSVKVEGATSAGE